MRKNANGELPKTCASGVVVGFGEQSTRPIVGKNPRPMPYNPHLQCTKLEAKDDSAVCAMHNAGFQGNRKFCAPTGTYGEDACRVCSLKVFMIVIYLRKLSICFVYTSGKVLEYISKKLIEYISKEDSNIKA